MLGANEKGTDMAKNEKSGRRRVTFVLRADTGSEVYLGGTFNDWDYAKKPLKESPDKGVFTAVCMLPPGTHEYKFHINGTWCVDPENPNFCQNNFGSLNSIIEVV
jgi:1,4-alpha-glucan branching enzyme